jgi:quinoprotein glucose dehydrogenase
LTWSTGVEKLRDRGHELGRSKRLLQENAVGDAARRGVPFSGGSITTRGGLTFIAASVEQAIRAYDVATGKEVWKARLPAGGQATPMTYRSALSGRQFIIIAAGGKPTLNTTQGTTLVAFALPP